MRIFSLIAVPASVVTALVVTSDPSVVSGKSFDYVIVGGGPGGLTVASRLAEDPTLSVLVIEAGPDAQNDTRVKDPGQFSAAGAAYDWGYVTTPQSVGGQSQHLTQGKVLGGGSSINGMDWNRGAKAQYDSLAALGNLGWSWDNLLGYMKKSERFHLPNANQSALGASALPQFHGVNGAIDAGFPQPYRGGPIISSFVKAFQSIIPGLQKNPDPSSGSPGGVFQLFFSLKPGNPANPNDVNTRSSAADGYIYPYENGNTKKGLTVLVNHLAARIVWSNATQLKLQCAKGVEFIPTPASGTTASASKFTVGVNREVIVSSGAIGSPHFLELSGIGDPSILQSAGITTRVNLSSVGTNLQDQALNAVASLISPTIPADQYTLTNEPVSPAAGYLGLSDVFGSSAPTIGTQLVNSVKDRASAIVASGAFTNQAGMEQILSIQAQEMTQSNAPVLEVLFEVIPGDNPLTVIVTWPLIPQWRGTVHVKSSDPTVPPEINPNYYTTTFDQTLQTAGVKLARQLLATPPLSNFTLFEVQPGAAIPANAPDAAWLGYVTASYQPVFHPLGSVPMLPREKGGAVDSSLKVYGTSNVRVVDSSIIPVQISAHPSATVYGIAEKAADIIKSVRWP